MNLTQLPQSTFRREVVSQKSSRTFMSSNPLFPFTNVTNNDGGLSYRIPQSGLSTEPVVTSHQGDHLPGSGSSLFPDWMMSTAVLSLFVVATLTAVAGLVYLLIYFKSIKPMTARTSRYCLNKLSHHHKITEDDANPRLRSTHPFFRRT